MSTQHHGQDGNKQVRIDDFTSNHLTFPEYREWRNSIEPPENPSEHYASNEQWKAFIDDGYYGVDWDAVEDDRLFVAMFKHAIKEGVPRDYRYVAKATMKKASGCFHPAIVYVPIELVEKVLQFAETNELTHEGKLLIEHIKRGLLRSSIQSMESSHGSQFSVDWAIEDQWIQSDDKYTRKIQHIPLLKMALEVADKLKCGHSNMRDYYIEMMYDRPHTPENRFETLFKNFTQTSIDSAISYALSPYFIGGIYKSADPYRWNKFFNVISDEELSRAIVTVATETREPYDEQRYRDEKVQKSKYPHHFEELKGFLTRHDGMDAHNVGMLFSRFSDEWMLTTIEKLDENDALTKTILHGVLGFGGTQDGRDSVYEMYKDREFFPADKPTVILQVTDNYERWKQTFIDVWRRRGGTKVHTLMQAGTAHLGANADASDNETQVYADGRPMECLTVSESFKDHASRLYNETQEYYSRYDDEKYRTVYRGVGESALEGKYIPATLESWSEHKREARKFVNDHNNILKREIQIPNVFATWESLGDAWPEHDVKGCKEWMILGGGLK